MSGRTRDRVESAIAFTALLVYVIWMIAPALQASFAKIDDHEIVYWLGADRTMRLSEVPSGIASTVIEQNGRFRPGYWVLRIVQICLFGDRPGTWHWIYLTKGLVTAACLFLALRNMLSLRPWQCAVVSAIFFAGPQSEIWARLGTAEADAVLVMAMSAWLLARHVRSGRVGPAGLAPGIVLLSTSALVKETFISLAPITFLICAVVVPARQVGWKPWRVTNRWRIADWAWTIGFVVMWSLNVAAILLAVKRHGHVYAGEATPWSYIETLRSMTRMIVRDAAYLISVPIVFAAVAEAQRRIRPLLVELAIVPAIILIAFIAIALPQAYFYAGSFTEARYRVPANLTAVAIVAACFYRIQVAASDASRKHTVGLNEYSPRIVFEFLIVAIIAWRCVEFGNKVRLQTIEYTAGTHDFADTIARVHTAAGPAETSAVILGGPASYEAVFSTQRFLHFLEPNRKIAVRVAADSAYTDLSRRLEQHLKTIQDKGGSAFVPLDEVLRDGQYIEIRASDARLVSKN